MLLERQASAGRIGRALPAMIAAALLPTSVPATPLLAYQVHEGLNDNAFLQDGQVAAHLLLRSGKAPRILIAFPAGDSGVGLWFEPVAGEARWTLTAKPRAMTEADAQARPLRGVVAEMTVKTSELRIAKAMLSSVRVLRDYQIDGRAPADLEPRRAIARSTVTWSRDRLDGAAGYRLRVQVLRGALDGDRIMAASDGKIALRVTALTGETPLTPFAPNGLLNGSAARDPGARNALAFLSYKEKFLAGSWRFDTYFGRDTLMSLRLLMPALTPPAIEAGLGSVLARLSPDGEVAHEEDVGEFAVLDHRAQGGGASDAPTYDYAMVDGAFELGPVACAWLLDDPRARSRASAFLAAADERPGGGARRRGDDLVANLRFVLERTAPFAEEPAVGRLIGLKPGRNTGTWRDSQTGLGGGRYPYDVNAVFAPAALDSAARLFASGLLDPYLTPKDRALFARAADMAQVWRRRAPGLFAVTVDRGEAARDVATYAKAVGVADPSTSTALGGGVRFFALSLDAAGQPVRVMNSDLGFGLLFGAPMPPAALDDAVEALMRPFPAGLMTGVGMVVANPAFAAGDLQPSFNRNAYHGAVVWSWQQALFAAGLRRQLQRNDLPAKVRADLTRAAHRIWRAIRAAPQMRNSELWSWSFSNGRYEVQPFGATGADADESNAAQLWSTVYLAVKPPVTLGRQTPTRAPAPRLKTSGR